MQRKSATNSRPTSRPANQANKSTGEGKKALPVTKALQWLIMLVIVISVFGSAVHQADRRDAILEELARVEAQIAQELHRQRELEDEAAFMQGRAFVEYVARNHLGLVHADEIIFVVVDEDD